MSKRTNALRRNLRDPFAPRVLDRSMVEQAVGETVPTNTLTRIIKDLEEAGDLVRVRRGLFLNGLAYPQPDMAEAARFVRAGAVVSLQTVLGDAGIHNNPTRLVTCVVPNDRTAKGHERDVRLPGATFRMHAVTPRILEAGDEDDRLTWTSYPRATPEAALLHWIYLGDHTRSIQKLPRPHDLDADLLDKDRLRRLAGKMRLLDRLEPLLERLHELDAEDGPPSP